MLASIPASTLNQSLRDLEIPNRFTLKSSRFNEMGFWRAYQKPLNQCLHELETRDVNVEPHLAGKGLHDRFPSARMR